MNKKLVMTAIAGAVVIILGLIWGLVYVASQNSDSSAPTQQQTSSTKQVQRSVTGKPIDEDRADVYKAATELLESTNAPAKQEDYQKLLSSLDKAKITDIPTGFLDKARFVDTLDKDELKITTYQALVTFASLSKASSSDGKIASLYADGPMTIYVDQETGTAQVPMNIFVNQQGAANTFSLEFVYVDGKWKFAPYSVLDQLRLSLGLQQQKSSGSTDSSK